MKSEVVAEIEGEYGPLTISERLVQKIWALGDFRQSGLRTLEGSTLELEDRGQWNRLAGPDFKDVRLRVDGEVMTGDAELHFFDSDWESHGHERDPAFKNVVLHILVFPPKPRKRSAVCHVPHSLLLLDLLPQGLENYAEEEALGALSSGDESVIEESLMSLSFYERLSELAYSARKRWLSKVNYAKNRIGTLGWEEACHQTALEILGYRYNRSAMLFIAGDYTLGALRSGNHTVSDLYEAGRDRWRVSGTRPANHPRQRLFQYFDWINQRPTWPTDLEALGTEFFATNQTEVLELTRKNLGLTPLRQKFSEAILADTVGGTRIETLICDGFLPLLAAQTGLTLFPYWFHWFPGDFPPVLKQLVRRVTATSPRPCPMSNGNLQGVLQRIVENSAAGRRS